MRTFQLIDGGRASSFNGKCETANTDNRLLAGVPTAETSILKGKCVAGTDSLGNFIELDLVARLRVKADSPNGPRPPAAARRRPLGNPAGLFVVGNRESDVPGAPDRRQPREPIAPVWLPEAA